MEDSPKGFEPYLDWSSVTEEMANDLHRNITAYKKAQEDFMGDPTPEKAAELLKPQYELNNIATGVFQTIYTTPVMVHVAGPKTEDKDDDGEGRIVQLCKRCGSVLQFWRDGVTVMTPTGPVEIAEENIPWWDEGDVVAKSTTPESMTVYQITEGRALEKHERPCPDFAGQMG